MTIQEKKSADARRIGLRRQMNATPYACPCGSSWVNIYRPGKPGRRRSVYCGDPCLRRYRNSRRPAVNVKLRPAPMAIAFEDSLTIGFQFNDRARGIREWKERKEQREFELLCRRLRRANRKKV